MPTTSPPSTNLLDLKKTTTRTNSKIKYVVKSSSYIKNAKTVQELTSRIAYAYVSNYITKQVWLNFKEATTGSSNVKIMCVFSKVSAACYDVSVTDMLNKGEKKEKKLSDLVASETARLLGKQCWSTRLDYHNTSHTRQRPHNQSHLTEKK